MSGYSVVIVGLTVVLACVAAWVFAPKQDQTVWRSSLILAMTLMYLMWAITYLCQLHPLVAPSRSDLRPEFAD